MAEAPAHVVSLLATCFDKLNIDADTYADYAAGMLADEVHSAFVKRGVDAPRNKFESIDTLTDMLMGTLDDSAPADVASQLRTSLDQAVEALFQHEAKTMQGSKAKEEAAAAQSSRVERMLAKERAAVDEMARAKESSGLDASVKAAIMMSYGYVPEDDDEEGGGAVGVDAAVSGGTAEAGVHTHTRKGGLDAALDALDTSGTGVDTTGMGRRAKRAAAAAAGGKKPDAPSGPKPASSSIIAGDVITPGSAKAAAARASAATSAASVAASRAADLVDMMVTPPDPMKTARNGDIVEYDPLHLHVNNREAEKEMLRRRREAERLEHEAEQKRIREAAEAARAAKERMKQARVHDAPAPKGSARK